MIYSYWISPENCMLKQNIKGFFRILFYIGLISLPFVLINQYYPNFFDYIIRWTSNHVLIFRLLRWSLILFILLTWKYFVCKLGCRYKASNELILFWESKVIIVVVWLALFELFICENIHLKLIHLL